MAKRPPSEYRTALVTGASSGMGRAIATALADRGLEVHALALPDTGLEAMCEATGCTAHALDIRDSARLGALAAEIAPDVLVNNAGILGVLKPAYEMTPAEIDSILDINLRAHIHCTRGALPRMVERKRGHVFFTGSIAGSIPTPNISVYVATKAGIDGFAHALRHDLLGLPIRVTVLLPGRVETNIYDPVFGGHAAAAERLYKGARSIQPEDVARVVLMALDLPSHVDVVSLEVLPTMQVFGGSRMAEPGCG